MVSTETFILPNGFWYGLLQARKYIFLHPPPPQKIEHECNEKDVKDRQLLNIVNTAILAFHGKPVLLQLFFF